MKTENEQKESKKIMDEPKAKGQQLDSTRKIPSNKQILND